MLDTQHTLYNLMLYLVLQYLFIVFYLMLYT
jgi:hypothetical protein